MSQIMLIECTLQRKGGTQVKMADNTTYHFKDDGTGAHIAAVSNADHIGTLLGIKEAYRVYGMQTADVAATGVVATTVQPIMVAPIVQAPVTAPAVTQAPAASTPPAQELQTPPPATTTNEQAGLSPDMNIDELRALFLAEVGREPNARAKAETMIAQIEAIRAERAA